MAKSKAKTWSPVILVPFLLIGVALGGALYILGWIWPPYVTLLSAAAMVSCFFRESMDLRGKENDNKRLRRLSRMGFIGSLLFLVASGFMISGHTFWILFYTAGVIYVLYSLLARP